MTKSTLTGKVRVYIATTEGPVEVQSLGREDAEVDSVVCLDGRPVPLPISGAYHDFVRAPVGVVEKLFGHGAFRMDVSGEIVRGNSWQLGALLAHALDHGGRLATKGEAAALVLWCTGEVDTKLAVHPVDAVEDKLDRSRGLIDGLRRSDCPMVILAPENNTVALRADLLLDLGIDGIGCRLIAVTDARAACAEMGVALPGASGRAGAAAKSKPSTVSGVPRSRRLSLYGATMALLLVLFAGAAGGMMWFDGPARWSRLLADGAFAELDEDLRRAEQDLRPGMAWLADRFRTRLPVDRPGPADLRFSLVERRVPRLAACDPGKAVAAVLAINDPASVPVSSAAGLCAITYRVEALSGPLHVGLFMPERRYQRFDTTFSQAAQRVAARIATGEAAGLDVEAPRMTGRPLDQRIIIVAARVPVEPMLDILAAMVGASSTPWADIEQRLARLGVHAVMLRHRLEP